MDANATFVASSEPHKCNYCQTEENVKFWMVACNASMDNDVISARRIGGQFTVPHLWRQTKYITTGKSVEDAYGEYYCHACWMDIINMWLLQFRIQNRAARQQVVSGNNGPGCCSICTRPVTDIRSIRIEIPFKDITPFQRDLPNGSIVCFIDLYKVDSKSNLVETQPRKVCRLEIPVCKCCRGNWIGGIDVVEKPPRYNDDDDYYY